MAKFHQMSRVAFGEHAAEAMRRARMGELSLESPNVRGPVTARQTSLPGPGLQILLFEGDGGLSNLVKRGDSFRIGFISPLRDNQVCEFGCDVHV